LDRIVFGIMSILCFIPALVGHEAAHAFAALRMGDTTAKDANRLTFNPLNHIDPFGTVLLPLMLVMMGMPAFGYAKPVPYDPRRLRNLKVGEVVVGLAGPTSNLLMALVAAAICFVLARIPAFWTGALSYVIFFLYYFGMVNLCIMFFNLLPIPPLDGSSVIMPLLPQRYIGTWYQIQRYALPFLFILIVVVPAVLRMIGINFNPLTAYIEFTAGNLSDLLFPYFS